MLSQIVNGRTLSIKRQCLVFYSWNLRILPFLPTVLFMSGIHLLKLVKCVLCGLFSILATSLVLESIAIYTLWILGAAVHMN
jgi:hypothetical protein